MKPTTFFSTFFLFTSIIAIPVAQAPTPTDSAVVAPSGEPAVSEYLVVMKDTEKRQWAEIFFEMGAKWPTIKAFKSNETNPFGENMRGFTVNVTQAQADNISTMPNVVSVEKNSAIKMFSPV